MRWILIGLIGIAGGFASSLFGVGGGALFVPLLILLVSFNPHTAIGTSLAVIIPTAFIGAIAHVKAGMFDWKTAAILAAFAGIGTATAAVLVVVAWASVSARPCVAVLFPILPIAMLLVRAGGAWRERRRSLGRLPRPLPVAHVVSRFDA